MQYYYLRTTHYDLRGQPQTKGSLVPLPRRLIRIRAIVCRGRCIRLGWLSKAGGRSIARLRLRTDKTKVAVANRIAGGRTAGNMTAAVERQSRSWSGAEEQGRTAVDFHTHPVAVAGSTNQESERMVPELECTTKPERMPGEQVAEHTAAAHRKD
jgi:hypothetical protein